VLVGGGEGRVEARGGGGGERVEGGGAGVVVVVEKGVEAGVAEAKEGEGGAGKVAEDTPTQPGREGTTRKCPGWERGFDQVEAQCQAG